jgi:hypothetical protein
MQKTLESFFGKSPGSKTIIPDPQWIIDLDCGTCLFIKAKAPECEGCAAWNHHKPNWSLIKEQNERQHQWELSFCIKYQYNHLTWDCGYLSCSNCVHYESNNGDKCLEGFEIIQSKDITHTTKIYGEYCGSVVTPDNQKEVHAKQKYRSKQLKHQSRLGCEDCHYFGYSFLKVPCGNCIQDFYLYKKKTLDLDELLTQGFLLGKKGIKDLSTANYVWDKTPAKPCINPIDKQPLCSRCTNEFCKQRVKN